jgi:hypothetical protein
MFNLLVKIIPIIPNGTRARCFVVGVPKVVKATMGTVVRLIRLILPVRPAFCGFVSLAPVAILRLPLALRRLVDFFAHGFDELGLCQKTPTT